jgi:hypothetical protein
MPSAKYFLKIKKCLVKYLSKLFGLSPSPSPPTVLGRGWDSSGSFQPQAVDLVMDLKP